MGVEERHVQGCEGVCVDGRVQRSVACAGVRRYAQACRRCTGMWSACARDGEHKGMGVAGVCAHEKQLKAMDLRLNKTMVAGSISSRGNTFQPQP